jgi:hypothetical protein
VSLRMLTTLMLADLRLTTAQQRSISQNLPSDLYVAERVYLVPRFYCKFIASLPSSDGKVHRQQSDLIRKSKAIPVTGRGGL